MINPAHTGIPSTEFRSPYEDQRRAAWKEFKELILPALVTAAVGTLAYKGFKKLKSMPDVSLSLKAPTKEQEILNSYRREIRDSMEKAKTDIPYRTSQMFEQWLKGR